jgi:hypothetical protein
MHEPSVMLQSQQVLQGGEGMPRGAAGSIQHGCLTSITGIDGWKQLKHQSHPALQQKMKTVAAVQIL